MKPDRFDEMAKAIIATWDSGVDHFPSHLATALRHAHAQGGVDALRDAAELAMNFEAETSGVWQYQVSCIAKQIEQRADELERAANASDATEATGEMS